MVSKVGSGHLLLSALHALRHRGPDVPLVFPESLLGLGFGDGADGVLLGLVANIAGQRHHGVDHVGPVVREPGDRVDITAVVDGNLNILRGEPGLLRLLDLQPPLLLRLELGEERAEARAPAVHPLYPPVSLELELKVKNVKFSIFLSE